MQGKLKLKGFQLRVCVGLLQYLERYCVIPEIFLPFSLVAPWRIHLSCLFNKQTWDMVQLFILLTAMKTLDMNWILILV